MTRIILCTVLLSLATYEVSAFTPSISNRRSLSSSIYSTYESDLPQFVDETQKNVESNDSLVQQQKSEPIKKTNKKTEAHKEGIFTPVVLLSKVVLGEEKLNKVRAKVISEHSNVIASFVETAESTIGTQVLKQLFYLADKDRSGTIEESELKAAMTSLGFDWIQEKQVQGIFARADKDGNGKIDIDEWIAEAPKTLRTNLIKLAKKNGGDLGFLS